MSEATLNHILEIFYILIGLQFLYTAYRALRSQDKSKSLGTALILLLDIERAIFSGKNINISSRFFKPNWKPK